MLGGRGVLRSNLGKVLLSKSLGILTEGHHRVFIMEMVKWSHRTLVSQSIPRTPLGNANPGSVGFRGQLSPHLTSPNS